MVDFSRFENRSITSFAVSFVIHFALIICFSLILFKLEQNKSILLEVSSLDEPLELMTFESPVFDSPDESELLRISSVQPKFEMPALPLDELPDLSSLQSSFTPEPQLFSEEALISFEEPSTGFFGIEPTGHRIVYIIDMSVSMRHRGYHSRRYDRAVAEVMRSIDQLEPDQTFYVYLFCFKKLEMRIGQSRGEFCAPTRENKEKLRAWLESINLGSGTDPRESIVTALERQPSCIFLLSDGEFNGVHFGNGPFGNRVKATQLATLHNVDKCPIHTIGLEDKANQRDLTVIAEQSGGIYKFIAAQRK